MKHQEIILGAIGTLLQIHYIEEERYRTHRPRPPTHCVLAIHIGPVPGRKPSRLDDRQCPAGRQFTFRHLRIAAGCPASGQETQDDNREEGEVYHHAWMLKMWSGWVSGLLSIDWVECPGCWNR
ncbi:hypothetical protein TNIN_434941 [Trichonephila inaurata madagascariensis]|uniref:Uncharacterized protein n=1 Tax=Trichonephila inaurata madagascariensis TaxID=2747483 RepID=A0A8X6XEP1_9ARAC|nr:hypothetical protein TNIN_434941 [Trichonephila inaurata madagascariensis]